MIAALLLAAAEPYVAPADTQDGTIFLCKMYEKGSEEPISLTFYTPKMTGSADSVSFVDTDNRLQDASFEVMEGDLSSSVGKRQFSMSTRTGSADVWLVTMMSRNKPTMFNGYEVLSALLGRVSAGKPTYTGDCYMMQGPVRGIFEDHSAEAEEKK